MTVNRDSHKEEIGLRGMISLKSSKLHYQLLGESIHHSKHPISVSTTINDSAICFARPPKKVLLACLEHEQECCPPTTSAQVNLAIRRQITIFDAIKCLWLRNSIYISYQKHLFFEVLHTENEELTCSL